MTPIDHAALFTDLYQLTMLQAYHARGMNETAVFELFVRRLPTTRNFLITAGLEQVVEFLEHLRFTPDELDWLKGAGKFHPEFVQWLASFRFTGDVDAMPEGTVFFPDEPILRVTAPMPEAQFVESRLINLLQFQTLIASKAARCVLAAPRGTLVDFGMRRAHGHEAGLLAARAAYLAGFAGTATVQAGQVFGIPVHGTMAHSFIQAHGQETEAFLDFAEANPGRVVLLIDTYDTVAAARKLVAMAQQFRDRGLPIHGVRLDSGDLADHARNVRQILDEGGLNDVTIFASGGLDEHDLERFTSRNVPIDGYGIGTRLNASVDAPTLDYVYKLQEYAGVARRKRSEGKATWPGRKQVYRAFDGPVMSRDTLTLETDPAEGTPLLQPVMRNSRRIAPLPSLAEIRDVVARNLSQLPPALKRLDQPGTYEVRVSHSIRELAKQVDESTAASRE